MKYKRIKRVISGLLSLVMIFGQIPLTAFADDNINLTPTEVREDTSVISKSFIYKGEKKTIYLANNEDGTSYMSGDIIYRTGGSGYTQVRHTDGFIELNKTYKDICIVNYPTPYSYDSLYLYLLADNGDLDTFTDTMQNETTYSRVPAQTKTIAENIKKISSGYFLDDYGNLRFIDVLDTGNKSNILTDIEDFYVVGEDILKVKTINGDVFYTYFAKSQYYEWDTPYLSMHTSFNLLKKKSIENGLELTVLEDTNGHGLKFITDKYLAYIENGSSSINFINSLTPIDENTYSLFNNKITVKYLYNDNDEFIGMDVTSSDGSEITADVRGVETKYGRINYYINSSFEFPYITIPKYIDEKLTKTVYNDYIGLNNKSLLMGYHYQQSQLIDYLEVQNDRQDPNDFSVKFDLSVPSYSTNNYYDDTISSDNVVHISISMTKKTYNIYDNNNVVLDVHPEYFSDTDEGTKLNFTALVKDIQNTYYPDYDSNSRNKGFGLLSELIDDYGDYHDVFMTLTPSNNILFPLDFSKGFTLKTDSVHTGVADGLASYKVGDKITALLDDLVAADSIQIGDCVLTDYTSNKVYNIDGIIVLDSDTVYDFSNLALTDNNYSYYSLDINNNLILSTKKINEDYDGSQFLGNMSTKIASNVVKFNSDGYYLTSDGNLYDMNKELQKTGVVNIQDNLYKVKDTWYYLDTNKEFKPDYATELNVSAYRNVCNNYVSVYQFDFDPDLITQVIAPNGKLLHPGESYSMYENGAHVFNIVNKYGDTFTKTIYIVGMTDITKLALNTEVTNGVVKLSGISDMQYSLDNNTWNSLSEDGIKYESPVYLKVKDTSKVYKLTLDENGKADFETIQVNGLSPENFCGLGYIRNGNLYTLEGYELYSQGDIVTAAVTSHLKRNDYDTTTEGTYVAIGADMSNPFSSNYDFSNKYISDVPVPYSDTTPMLINIFRSDKLKYENKVTNPVKVFINGIYTYIIGDSGDLVKAYEGNEFKDINENNYGSVTLANWNEEWLTDKVESWDNNGLVKLSDGTNYDLTYNERLGKPVTSLKFYKENTSGGYAEVEDLTISAFRPTSDGYAVLASDNNAYVYNADIDGLVYAANLNFGSGIDYSLSNTNWTNKSINLSLSIPKTGVSPYDDRFNYYDNEHENWGRLIYDVYDTEIPVFKGLVADKDNSSIKLYINSSDLKDSNVVDVNKPLYKLVNSETGDEYLVTSISDLDTGKSSTSSLSIEDSDVIEYTYIVPKGIYDICILEDNFNHFYGQFSTYAKNDIDNFVINDTWHSYKEYINIEDDIDSLYGVHYADENMNIDSELINNKPIYTIPKNGTYTINLYDINNHNILDTTFVTVGNIDTVKPVINKVKLSGNNLATFEFKDVAGTGDDSASAISGIKESYYSTDNKTFNLITKPLKYNGVASDDYISIDTPNVYVYTVDNAGNKSEIYEVSIDMTISHSFKYENNKTTTNFYADLDKDNTDNKYSYSYEIEEAIRDGHQIISLTDETAKLMSTKTLSIPTSVDKIIDIKVVNIEKPNISDINEENEVTVTVGAIKNADFDKLYVKIDNDEYKEYNVQEVSIDSLSEGTHVIQSYETAVREGQVVTGDVSTKIVTSTPLKDIVINPIVTYENGKTSLDFYANDDKNHDKGYTYSYKINNKVTDGHELSITENTTVTMIAKKKGFKDGEKVTNLVVIKTEIPNISDLENNSVVTITKGDIKDAYLKTLSVKVDDNDYTDYESAEKILSLTNAGEHTITAYQTVVNKIDGQNIEIKSQEAVKKVNVKGSITIHDDKKYENHKTTVDFYGNEDKNHSQGYSYSTILNDENKDGYSITVDKDSTVSLNATHKDYMPSSKDVDVKVIDVETPTISDLIDNTSVDIQSGVVKNTNFDKLYIKIDNDDYREFNSTLVNLPLTDGKHTISAYESTKITIDGKEVVINSDITTKDVEVLKYIVLHPTIKYNNGSSELDFYANDDKDSNKYTYSYILNNKKYDGSSIKATETTEVTITAEKSGYIPKSENIVIPVLKTDAPNINKSSKNSVKVTAGEFSDNASLKYLSIRVDDDSYKNYATSEFDLSNLTEGKHTIRAKQTIYAILDGAEVDITSSETTFDIDVKSDIVKYNLIVNDHFGNKTEKRLEVSLIKGTEFFVTALGRDSWEVNGKSEESGVLNKDTVIDFYYDSVDLDNPDTKYYTLTVIDKFDTDSEVRLVRKVKSGYAYSIDAINKDGWSVDGRANYEGTVTKNTTLTFKYIKSDNKYDTVSLKVVDKFGDDIETRYQMSVPKGYYYSVASIDRDGWQVQGTDLVSGVINTDSTIEFNYTKKSFDFIINDHFKDDVQQRSIERLPYGTEFIATSLALDDWNVVGDNFKTGIISGKTVVDFYYEKGDVTIDTKPIYHKLKVTDHFGDKSEVRLERTMLDGEKYEYIALNKSGWAIDGNNKYSGKATKDIDINFYYKADDSIKSNDYTLKVIDHFEDNVEIRFSMTVPKGYYYNVGALDRDTWRVIDKANYSGTISKDTTLDFYYESTLAKYYNLTIIDNFDSNSKIRCKESFIAGTEFTVSALSLDDWNVVGDDTKSGVMDKDITVEFFYDKDSPKPSDNENYFTLKVIDHFGDNDTVRITRKVKQGYNYSYSPLVIKGYKPTDESVKSGTVSKDTTIDFYYDKITEPESDEPTPDKPDEPDKPTSDQDKPAIHKPDPIKYDDDSNFPIPKTGDSSNIALYLIILLLSGSTAVASVLKKVHKK